MEYLLNKFMDMPFYQKRAAVLTASFVIWVFVAIILGATVGEGAVGFWVLFAGTIFIAILIYKAAMTFKGK